MQFLLDSTGMALAQCHDALPARGHSMNQYMIGAKVERIAISIAVAVKAVSRKEPRLTYKRLEGAVILLTGR